MTATVEEKLPGDTKPVFIEVLTDEELRVLDGGNSMVVSPYADQVAEVERDPILRTAFRGLVARGIIDPTPQTTPAGPADGTDPQLTPVDVLLRADVQTLITLRTNAVQVVAVARTAKGGQDYWYAHSIEEITLVEEVSQDGLHRFALAQTDQLPELLVAATVLTDAADGVGEPLTVDATDPEPDAVLARLGQGYLRADILVRHRDVKVPPVLGVFTGPEGSWTLEAGAPGDVECTPVIVRDLRKRVRGLVA